MKQNTKSFLRRAASIGLLVTAFNTSAYGTESDDNSKTVSLYNLHTDEAADITFWQDGAYSNAEMDKANHLLRDHRTQEAATISPRLLDLLYDIKTELHKKSPETKITFNVISGYRSPESNESLRAAGGKVAKQSQHTMGTAIDIRVPGIDLRTLRDAAWCLQGGGLGYYPQARNNFIHVDVARVRFWPAKKEKWGCD